jgi:hypothetical protein
MALTFRQISSVLGPTDADLAAAITATDASLAELEEAWAWLQNDEALINDIRPMPKGKIERLIEIIAPPSDEDLAS